jgi:regulatory protein
MRSVAFEEPDESHAETLLELDMWVSTISEFGLRPGARLTDGEFARVRDVSLRETARLKAVRYLAKRDMSRRELTEKLARAGVEREYAEAAADSLERAGMMDEAGYAADVVRRCAGKGYAAGRARQELRRRGVDRELWDEALSAMPDMGEAAFDFYRSRADGASRRGAAEQAMYRRGFSWDEISRARERYRAEGCDGESGEWREE